MSTATISPSPIGSRQQASLWKRFRKAHGITYVVLSLIGVAWVFPFFWMILGSMTPQREIMAVPPTLLPKNPTMSNFGQWFTQLHFGTYFTNSLVVAILTMLGNPVFCSMVGYALAKMDFAGKNVLFLLARVTLMVPSVATFIPLFGIIANLHMLNTYFALVLPFLTQPVGVFLVRRFMQGIADALLEARATRWRRRAQGLLPDRPAPVQAASGDTGRADLSLLLEQLPVAAGLCAVEQHVHPAGGPVFVFHGAERDQLQRAPGRCGPGRDINRHYCWVEEIDRNLERPVVQALNALCRMRNSLNAFDGDFSWRVDGEAIVLSWDGVSSCATLEFHPSKGLRLLVPGLATAPP
ncbi:sucrose phosphorylase domain-containing protein [Bifidobacterium aemilianum]